MHTIMIVAGGLVLLAVMLFIGRSIGDGGGLLGAAKIFIPIWLMASLVNMWVGVNRAGYTFAEELPILIPVFGLPAAVAVLAAWYFSR